MKKTVKTEWGAYGHAAALDVFTDQICDLCGLEKRVLCIDTSGEEYAALKICAECFTKEIRAKGPDDASTSLRRS